MTLGLFSYEGVLNLTDTKDVRYLQSTTDGELELDLSMGMNCRSSVSHQSHAINSPLALEHTKFSLKLCQDL